MEKYIYQNFRIKRIINILNVFQYKHTQTQKHTHTHTHSGYECFSSAVTNLQTLNQSVHALVYLCGLTKASMARNDKHVEFTLHTQHCILLYWPGLTGDTFDWIQICKCITCTPDTQRSSSDTKKRLEDWYRGNFMFPLSPMRYSAVVEGLWNQKIYFLVCWRSRHAF